jgi:hypothetical protein
VASVKIVVLFAVNITTGFGFVFCGITTKRAPEIVQIRFLCGEFLKLRGNPQQKGSINKNRHNEKKKFTRNSILHQSNKKCK